MAGIPVVWWLNAFDACSEKYMLGSGEQSSLFVRVVRFPDGEPWLFQEHVLTQIFELAAKETGEVLRNG